MGQVELLRKQHEEILGLINEIENIVENRECINKSNDIVKLINRMSGILKVHLNIEDRYLYPELIDSSNYKLGQIAKEYMEEMGGLVNEYNVFKSQFNTSNKLSQRVEEFEEQSKLVFSVLKNRILKEDSELYPLSKL